MKGLALNDRWIRMHLPMMIPLVICGICGGLVTVLAKIAFSSSSLVLDQLQTFCITHEYSFSHEACANGAYIFRGSMFILMLAMNGAVVNFFMKAMEQNHTVVVIVITSAMNFLTSGICGALLLGEELTQAWFSGSLMIMMGMLFVAYSQGTGPRKT